MSRATEEITVILVCVTIGFLIGFSLSEVALFSRMKRQSVEGYKAKASYVTNSLGEITIDKITWSK